jgi:hypothetical protein
MVSYKVGNIFFNNIYLTLRQAQKTGNSVEFYCYDAEFDQYNWTQEPEASLDFLMLQHAQDLRNRYERLVLLWSGGTDSHTIYNVFKQGGIHLDEIIIKADKTEGSIFPEENADWLFKNHWDPTTQLTRYDDYDHNLRLIDLPNEDWVWKNGGDLYKYGMTSTANGVRLLCEKNHAGKKWRAIGGYEKPRLVYRDQRWYHRQLATVLEPTMGYDYVEHFFFQPLIAIKQAHMIKQSVKLLIASNQLPVYEGDWAEAKWPKTLSGYRDWAFGCGRHEELNVGISHHQKTVNDAISKTEISTHGHWKDIITADRRLKADLENGIKVAENFVKGLHNLRSEFGFVTWLKDNGWLRANSNTLTNLNFVWSKEYDLGT